MLRPWPESLVPNGIRLGGTEPYKGLKYVLQNSVHLEPQNAIILGEGVFVDVINQGS